MSEEEQSQSAIREEKRTKGGKGPLIYKAFLIPILYFALMIATNGIALGVFGLVHTNDYSLGLVGAVSFGIFGMLSYSLLLGYRALDRMGKRQPKHEYQGAFGSRIRPSENAVAFFIFLGFVIGAVTGVLGAHAQGVLSPTETFPLLFAGATAFVFGFDRMRQRSEIRHRKKKRRRIEKAAILALSAESRADSNVESLRLQEATPKGLVELAAGQESTTDTLAPTSQDSQAAIRRSNPTSAFVAHPANLMD